MWRDNYLCLAHIIVQISLEHAVFSLRKLIGLSLCVSIKIPLNSNKTHLVSKDVMGYSSELD